MSGAAGERAQCTAGSDHARELAVRGVQRVRNRTVAVAFGLFPKVDEDEFILPARAHHLVRGEGTLGMRLVLLAAPHLEVRRNRDVHHLRIGQVQGVHERRVFVRRRDLEPGVAGPLLADGAGRVALVVVTGKDQDLVGQGEQLVEQGVVLSHRIAVLEVGCVRSPG